VNTNKNNRSPRFELGLSSGINALSLHYKSNEAEWLQTKNNSESLSLGISYAASLKYFLNQSWILRSGVESHNYYSKLDHTSNKTFNVTKEDAITTIYLDAFSGDTLNIERGTQIVAADSITSIIHHNRYRVISIPLEFGFVQNSGSLRYGLSAGLALNLTRHQEGRTLDQQEQVVDFESADQLTAMKKTNIAYRLRPIFGYTLSDNWTIELEPLFQWSRRSNYNSENIQVNISQFHINLGVSYKLN